MLKNKLNITNISELNREEERLTKLRAKELFDSGKLGTFDIGTFKGLSQIHHYLFQDIYDFAGEMREVNIAKDWFSFSPRIFLEPSLAYIDGLPHSNFDEILDKYADMNVAHPFREGNGRPGRIWLDCMLKNRLGKVVDWNEIDKNEYMNAMIRCHVSTGELKYLIQKALTQDLSRESFMKGIDASYYYEGYSEFSTRDL